MFFQSIYMFKPELQLSSTLIDAVYIIALTHEFLIKTTGLLG